MDSITRFPRRAASLLLALAVTSPLAAAACGDDAGTASPGSSATDASPSAVGGTGDGADAEAEAGGTVEIAHRYGTTEVPVAPERVVSLDTQWTDVLLALDAPPVGYLLDPNVDGGSFPWRGDGLADATGLSATDTLPYEQIAALRPDVIMVSYVAEDQQDYDRLAAIAPTVATLTDRQVDTWQDIARAAGTMLGAPDDADALVAEVEQGVADLADELPGLAGKSFVLANFVPGEAFYVVSDPDDGANVVFGDLGMTLSPTVLEAGEGVAGRVELSLEQANLLDADLLVLFTNGADAEEIVGYDDLPAVRTDAAAVLDYTMVVGLNTPSPLSLPYALDAIRPALDAAAGA